MFFRLIFLGSVIGGTGNTNFAFLRVLLNLKDAFYLLTFPMSRYDIIIFFILIIFLSSGKLRKYILNREILYCSLWIFLTLIPVFGLITRWYMYIPSIGLCMMLSIIITSLAKINFYFKITLSVIFIFFLSLNIYLLRKEACLWNSSGKLVKTITEDIYSYSKDRETFYIFNLPAALLDSDFFSSGEKPVFAYNIEKAVNTIYSSKLYIYPVTTVFLLNIDGGCEILKTGENKFLLKLDERKSRFSYHRDEFISGRVVPALGVEIENDKFILTTDKLNSEVIVEFKDHISNNSLFEFRKGHIVPLNLSGSR